MQTRERKNYLEIFHNESRRVSALLDVFIISQLKKREDYELLNFLYKKFTDRKIGTTHSRGTFVYIASKVFNVPISDDIKEILPLMAVVELAIWSGYAINWVTDEKNNVSGTKFEENIDILASQYLITEALYFLPDRMLKKYLEWYRYSMIGYVAVEKDLTITNFEKVENEADFWVAYSRNHCITDVGALYAYCFEAIDELFALNISAKQLVKIRKIMLEFGRALQMNGDASDFIIPNEFISTTEKRPQKDYFIDIRTDRLTYPIWLMLKQAKTDDPEFFKEIKKVSSERRYTKGFYEKVHAYMKKNSIIEEILTFIRKEKNRLSKEIDKLGINNEGTELWKASLITLTGNKFARQLKIDYNIRKHK